MIEYKCIKCKHIVQEAQKSKSYSIEDLKNETILHDCPVCGGRLNKLCKGISFKTPIYDLSYAKSYKRFKKGLHYDTTVKDKERTAELNAEMKHNNSQVV